MTKFGTVTLKSRRIITDELWIQALQEALATLGESRPDIVARASQTLGRWRSEMLLDHPTGVDPMDSVIAEGGPWHVRGQLAGYLARLRASDRTEAAQRLRARHPNAV